MLAIHLLALNVVIYLGVGQRERQIGVFFLLLYFLFVNFVKKCDRIFLPVTGHGDFGFWILDFGFWILDFGLVVLLHAPCPMPDTRRCKFFIFDLLTDFKTS